MVERYATRAEAAEAGAFRRGWLPEFLPASMVEVHEVHELDTNRRWLSFRADTAELRALSAGLEPLSLADARRWASDRPRAVKSGWPPELDKGMLATPRGERQLGLFRKPSENYCLAVEWRTGRAFGWACSESNQAAAAS